MFLILVKVVEYEAHTEKCLDSECTAWEIIKENKLCTSSGTLQHARGSSHASFQAWKLCSSQRSCISDFDGKHCLTFSFSFIFFFFLFFKNSLTTYVCIPKYCSLAFELYMKSINMNVLSDFFHKAWYLWHTCMLWIILGYSFLFLKSILLFVNTTMLSYLQLDSWVVWFCYYKQCCYKHSLKAF